MKLTISKAERKLLRALAKFSDALGKAVVSHLSKHDATATLRNRARRAK